MLQFSEGACQKASLAVNLGEDQDIPLAMAELFKPFGYFIIELLPVPLLSSLNPECSSDIVRSFAPWYASAR